MSVHRKRYIALILTIIQLCVSGVASALTQLSNSTTYTINGNTIKASDVAWQGSDGCWDYALKIYTLIWGSSDGYTNKFGSSNNILKNLDDNERKVTVEHIRYFIGKAKLGSVIRICGCSSSCSHWGNDSLKCRHAGHSMILVAKDANSLTVVHNAGSAVRTTRFTWSEFYQQYGAKGYTYFKYIKWPGASPITAYQPYTTVDTTPRIAKSIKARTDNSDDDQCYLKEEPYEVSDTVDIKASGEIIYIKGAVKNDHGNTWYQLESGYFVYSGDVEILEPNATILSETPVSMIGVSKTSDCYLKDKPYEASAHSATVAKGKAVEIVAVIVNYHDHIWYKTADGHYIYKDDVTTYSFTELFDISASFRNTEKRDSHVAPYLDSADVRSYAKGATVTVTRFVVNGYGNIWAQLSDGSFLCFYDFDTGENKLTYIGVEAAVTVSGVQKPTGDLTLGKSFNLYGVLTSTVPFYSVTAHIINAETNEYALSKVTVSPGYTVRSVNLNKSVNGTNINMKVAFGKLPKGYYHYGITALMGFTYNGKTFYFGTETIVIKSEFTVGNPVSIPEVEEPPLGDVVPARTPGDVNEDGIVNTTDALLILKYMAGFDVTITLANADCNSDGAVNTTDALLILQFMAGFDVTLK